VPTITPPPGYTAAQQVTVGTGATSVGGSTVTPVAQRGTDYAVRISLIGAAATPVYAALSDQAAGLDLSVWWYNGTVYAQIDCDVEAVGPAAISVWFKLQAAIGGLSSDGNYLLAYGNPSPTIRRAWANIYPLQDDFTGSTLDLSKWSNYNGVILSFAGSVMTIKNSTTMDIPHNNCGVQSVLQYGDGFALRGRGTMPRPAILNSPTIHTSLRLSNGDSSQNGGATRHECLIWNDPGNGAGTSPPSNPTNWEVSSFNDDGSGHFSVPATLQAVDAANHIFNVGRDPASGNAYGWVDEAAVGQTTDQPSSIPGWVCMHPTGDNNPNCVTQTWDWMKLRPFVAAEPTTALGVQVFNLPGLVAWPFA